MKSFLRMSPKTVFLASKTIVCNYLEKKKANDCVAYPQKETKSDGKESERVNEQKKVRIRKIGAKTKELTRRTFYTKVTIMKQLLIYILLFY